MWGLLFPFNGSWASTVISPLLPGSLSLWELVQLAAMSNSWESAAAPHHTRLPCSPSPRFVQTHVHLRAMTSNQLFLCSQHLIEYLPLFFSYYQGDYKALICWKTHTLSVSPDTKCSSPLMPLETVSHITLSTSSCGNMTLGKSRIFPNIYLLAFEKWNLQKLLDSHKALVKMNDNTKLF